MLFQDRVVPIKKAEIKMGMEMLFVEPSRLMGRAKGTFFMKMWDARTGEVLLDQRLDNVLTLDSGIIAARLFKNSAEPRPGYNNGLHMLAVGTGATGNLLNPDAPQPTKRRLNNEIARKPFSSTQWRNADGVAVAYPTNIVDFTTTFGEGEAVGPLNEMALFHTYSANPADKNLIPADKEGALYDPTFDVTLYDLMANYLTYSVVTKPSTAVLALTWRLTF